MLKKYLVSAILIAGFSLPVMAEIMANPEIPKPRQENNNLLTGDKRLACEAILCLSTGARPSECRPSLRRYFSIRGKHAGRNRANFLKQCPSSNENGMPNLINTLVEGAGRCDAATLNATNRRVVNGRAVISNEKPAHCQALERHPWTDVPRTVFQPEYCTNGTRGFGRPNRYVCGGKWVDLPYTSQNK